MRSFQVIVLLVLCAVSVHAEPLAPVGQGLPRTTLAYMIAKPDAVLQLAGYDGKDFAWAQDVRQDWPPFMGKAIDMFRDLVRDAERIDAALIGIQLSGPSFYCDVTLGKTQKCDLTLEWLPIIQTSEVEYHGIKVKRYTMGDNHIFAFIRAGHLYICNVEGAASQLCSALAKGPIAGESLAEFGRFRTWYESRKPVSVELWINAHELNRWASLMMEQELMEGYNLVDSYLEASHWERFTVALDLNQDKQLASFAIDIVSQREIPVLAKLGLNAASLKLARYFPASAGGVVGIHLGNLSALFKRIADEVRKHEASETPDDMHGLDAKIADFEAGLASVGISLKLDDVLGIFDGDAIGGVCAPAKGEALGVPGEQMPVYIAIGLAKRQLLVDTIDKALANESNPVRGMLTKEEFRGHPVYTIAGKGKLCIASDAALLVVANDAGQCDRVLGEMMDASVELKSSPRLQEVLRKESTLSLGVDIFAWLDWWIEDEVGKSRVLSAYAQPLWYDPAAIRALFEGGMAASMSVGITPKSFHLDLEARGMNVTEAIAAGKMTSQRDSRWYYAEAQAEELARAIESFSASNGKSPTSFDQMLETKSIRLAYLQSPFDSRFENASKVQWFASVWRLDDPDAQAEAEIAAILAAERKGFRSYTLVAPAGEQPASGWRIVAYQTNADTAGGRTVAYANGRAGWLHADVWKDALVLIEKGEEIPAIRQTDYYDLPPEEMEDGAPPVAPEFGDEGESEGAGEGEAYPEPSEPSTEEAWEEEQEPTKEEQAGEEDPEVEPSEEEPVPSSSGK